MWLLDSICHCAVCLSNLRCYKKGLPAVLFQQGPLASFRCLANIYLAHHSRGLAKPGLPRFPPAQRLPKTSHRYQSRELSNSSTSPYLAALGAEVGVSGIPMLDCRSVKPRARVKSSPSPRACRGWSRCTTQPSSGSRAADLSYMHVHRGSHPAPATAKHRTNAQR